MIERKRENFILNEAKNASIAIAMVSRFRTGLTKCRIKFAACSQLIEL